MSRRQYGSGAVFQRRDGMWIGRFEAGTDRDGKRRRITVTAATESRCKERLEAKKREVARTGVPEKISGQSITVESWIKQWLAERERELRPKSYATTASIAKQWIVPTIGRRRLVALTPADVRAVLDAMRMAGKVESTRARAHSDLMQMLKAAILEGHDIPQRVLLVKKPRASEHDREAIPVDQAVALLKQVADRDDAARWAAALLQGMRQAERLGLTWACVDFDRDVIDISWQLQPLPYIDNADKSAGFRVPDGYTAKHLVQAFHLVRPKTAKGQRVIPMVPWMRAALLAWRAKAPENSHDLVWTAGEGLPIRDSADRQAWKDIQEAAGVSHPAGRRYHVQEARHATVTLLLTLGVERAVVEAIVGHSRLVATYDHTDTLPRARAALELLAERLALTT